MRARLRTERRVGERNRGSICRAGGRAGVISRTRRARSPVARWSQSCASSESSQVSLAGRRRCPLLAASASRVRDAAGLASALARRLALWLGRCEWPQSVGCKVRLTSQSSTDSRAAGCSATDLRSPTGGHRANSNNDANSADKKPRAKSRSRSQNRNRNRKLKAQSSKQQAKAAEVKRASEQTNQRSKLNGPGE